MNIIPTDTAFVFWSQITNLDGIDYILEFRYNQREACYYLQISLTDRTVVAQGIKLVSNYRLLQTYASDLMPPGEMFAIAPVGNDAPAAYGELGIGQRVELWYQTQAEMQAANLDGWRERLK